MALPPQPLSSSQLMAASSYSEKRHESQASFIAAWWVTFAAAIGGIILSAVGVPVEGGAVAVLGFAPLYINLDRKHFPAILIGPCTTIYLFHLAGYSLGPLAQRYILGVSAFIESGFVQAQWGAVIGLATFALVYPRLYRGWMLAGSVQELTQSFGSDSARWKRYTLALLIVFIFHVAFGFLSGAYRRLGTAAEVSVGVQSLVSGLIDIRAVVWFFLGFGAVRYGRKWTLVWAVTLAMFSAYIVLDGSRGPVVFAMLFSAIGAAAAGFSRRNLVLLLVGFAIVFSPVAAIVSDQYRLFYQGADYSFVDRALEFTEAAQDYAEYGGSDLLTSIGIVLWQSTAHTVDRIYFFTPQVVPFAGLSGVERLLYLYLPRAVAPNRQNLHDGSETACVYAVLAGQFTPGDPRCGMGDYTPTVGDAYRRFGWPGIPFLYALQAVVFGFSLRFVWERSTRVEWVAIFVALIYLAQGAWSNTFISTFYMIGWIFMRDLILFWGLGKLADLFEKERVKTGNSQRIHGF